MKLNLQLINILVALLLVPFANAQSNENWAEVNLSVVDSQVIPNYADLAQAANQLSSSASEFCSAVDEDSLLVFQNTYQQTMDAWEGIQHVQFGPITYFNWNFRMQYWPDEKGTGAKQLDALIASANSGTLELNSFARQSVGIQGLPALEKLLFSDDSLAAFQTNSFRCQVSQTIAENIHEIAAGAHARWVEEFRATMANADDSDAFESAEDATIELLKSVVETVPKLVDQKLVPVLGESFERVRTRRSESWRSERSLRNLKINMLTLADFFNQSSNSRAPLSSVFLDEDVVLINGVFTAINQSLAVMGDSMSVVLDNQEGWEALVNVRAQLEELDELLENGLKNTDLYLGFNSLDGD